MRVHSNGRVRRSRSEWREIFDRFKASGLSQTEFRRREGIAKGTFSRWMTRLADEQPPAADPGPFVELTPAAAEPPARSLLSGELELSLPGGVRIRWKG